MTVEDVAVLVFFYSIISTGLIAWIMVAKDPDTRAIFVMTLYGVMAIVAITVAATLSVVT